MGQPGIVLALSDQDILDEVGHRLHSLRRRRGLGQGDVARATGIEVSTLSRYESGKAKNPSLVKIVRLVEFYGVSFDWLFSDLGSTRVVRGGEVTDLRLVEGSSSVPEGPIQLPTMARV